MYMRWFKNGARFLMVTVGIVVLTSFGIDASQYLTGSQSALGLLADRATEGGCPVGMAFVENGVDDYCIDTYEVAVGRDCPVKNPGHASQSAENIQQASCLPESVEDALPWTYVTYHQAVELCAKAGKRLPNQTEWYKASLGTDESKCSVNGNSVLPADKNSDCKSAAQAINMIGNVWEWVSGDVVDGVYNNRPLPVSGYVLNADSAGVATETSEDAQVMFHDDYFWSRPDGIMATMRGGYYGSGSDAGIYSIHADVELNFSGSAVGFRCVADT